MNDNCFCSRCHWSTEERWHFPPRWYCLVNKRKLIVRDEDVCKDYVKLTIQSIKQGAKREV